MEKYQLLFFDTFIHNGTDLNLDLISFRGSVTIGEVRVIPLGARVCANMPGGERMGATNPSQFMLDLFVNDLAESGLSVFQPIGSIDYDQKRTINLVLDSQVPTDGLVVRGRYSTITLAVYGIPYHSQHHLNQQQQQQQQQQQKSNNEDDIRAHHSESKSTVSVSAADADGDGEMTSKSQPASAQCQEVAADDVHVTRGESCQVDVEDKSVSCQERVDRTSVDVDKPPVPIDVSVPPVDSAPVPSPAPPHLDVAPVPGVPGNSCGVVAASSSVGAPPVSTVSSSPSSNLTSAQCSSHETVTVSSVVSTASSEAGDTVNTRTLASSVATGNSETQTVENHKLINQVVPDVTTDNIDVASEASDRAENTTEVSKDSTVVEAESPREKQAASASATSLVDLLMTTDDMESISDEEIQELESNHDQDETDDGMAMDDRDSALTAPSVGGVTGEVVDGKSPNIVVTNVSVSATVPPTSTAFVPSTSTVTALPPAPLDTSAGSATAREDCDLPAPAELEDIESEDDLMDDESGSLSDGRQDEPMEDCDDVEDEFQNFVFDPLSFQPAPLKTLTHPWLTRYQRSLLTADDDTNSASVSARAEIIQLLNSDICSPCSLVETMEQLNRLFETTWIPLEDDPKYLQSLASLLRRGLDYTLASAQIQLPYKIRQLKSALRLCCRLFSTSDTICSQMISLTAAVSSCGFLHRLLDICRGEFMAVSLKLMAVRALSIAVRWPSGLKAFIQVQERTEERKGQKLAGQEEGELSSCYERVIISLLDKNQSRLKAAYAKLIRKVHVYRAVCEFCTLSELISRDLSADCANTADDGHVTTSVTMATGSASASVDAPAADCSRPSPRTDSMEDVGDGKDGSGNGKGGCGDIKDEPDYVQEDSGDVKHSSGSVGDGLGDMEDDRGDVKDAFGSGKDGLGNAKGGCGDVKDEPAELEDESKDFKDDSGDIKDYPGNGKDIKNGSGDMKDDRGDAKDGPGNRKNGNGKGGCGDVKDGPGNDDDPGFGKNSLRGVEDGRGDGNDGPGRSPNRTRSDIDRENVIDRVVMCLNKLRELLYRSSCLLSQSCSTQLPLCSTAAGLTICSRLPCSWCESGAASSGEILDSCYSGALCDLLYTLDWAGFAKALVVLVSSPLVFASCALGSAVSALIKELASSPAGLLSLSANADISTGLLTALLTRKSLHQPVAIDADANADILYKTGCILAHQLYTLSQLDILFVPSNTPSRAEENCAVCCSYSSERFEAVMCLLRLCWSGEDVCEAVSRVLCSGSGSWLLAVAEQLRPPAAPASSCSDCSDTDWSEQPVVLASLHLLAAIASHVPDDSMALCRLSRMIDTLSSPTIDGSVSRDSAQCRDSWLDPLRVWLVPSRLLDDIGALCTHCNALMNNTPDSAPSSDSVDVGSLDWCHAVWPLMRHLCALISAPSGAGCGKFERQFSLSSGVAMCSADVLHMATCIIERITAVAIAPATVAASSRLMATTASGHRVLCLLLSAVRLLAAQLFVAIDSRKSCARDVVSLFPDITAVQSLIDAFILAWLVDKHDALFAAESDSAVAMPTPAVTASVGFHGDDFASGDVTDIGDNSVVLRLQHAIVEALSTFTLSTEPLARIGGVTCTTERSPASVPPLSETLCTRMVGKLCETLIQSMPLALLPCVSLFYRLVALSMPPRSGSPSDQRYSQWVGSLAAGCGKFLAPLAEILALTCCCQLSEIGLKLLGRLADLSSALALLVSQSVLELIQQSLTLSLTGSSGGSHTSSRHISCYLQVLTRLMLRAPVVKLAVISQISSPASSASRHQLLLNHLLQLIGPAHVRKTELLGQRSVLSQSVIDMLVALCNPDIFIQLIPCSPGESGGGGGESCRLPCGASLNPTLFSRLLTGVPPPSMVEALLPPLCEYLVCGAADLASAACVLRVLSALADAPGAQVLLKRYLLEKSPLPDLTLWLCGELGSCTSSDHLSMCCHHLVQLLQRLEQLLTFRELVVVLRWCEQGEEAGEVVDTPLRMLLKQLQALSSNNTAHFSTISAGVASLVSRLEGAAITGLLSQPSPSDIISCEQLLSLWPKQLQLSAVWSHRQQLVVGATAAHPAASSNTATAVAAAGDVHVQQITVDLSESVWPVLDCKDSLMDVLSRETAAGLSQLITLATSPSASASQHQRTTNNSSNTDTGSCTQPSTTINSPSSSTKPNQPLHSTTTTPAHSSTGTLPPALPHRSIDHFRSRAPNTSRPPSLHVDEFVALERRSCQMTPRLTRVTRPGGGGDGDGRDGGDLSAAAMSMRRRRRRRAGYRSPRMVVPGMDLTRPPV